MRWPVYARNPHPNDLPKGEGRKRQLTFRHSVKVAVERPEFELLDAVSHLDVAALERAARAEIEVGYVESACCRQLVRAVIRKGMVIELKVEPCAGEALEPSPDLLRLLEAARRVRDLLPIAGEGRMDLRSGHDRHDEARLKAGSRSACT